MSRVNFIPVPKAPFHGANFLNSKYYCFLELYTCCTVVLMNNPDLLLKFWEQQMKKSHRSSNFFFRKSPSHYHMMLLVMNADRNQNNLSVEELKTKLFKTSRPKSAIIINEACEKGFFYLETSSIDTSWVNFIPVPKALFHGANFLKQQILLFPEVTHMLYNCVNEQSRFIA